MDATASIGAAAKQAGVSVEALRYYEAAGLMPTVPRDASGRRRYDQAALDQLDIIVTMRGVGFSVQQVRRMLTAKEPDGAAERIERARALLAELPHGKEGWNFGELPLVTLSVSDSEFQVLLVTDDHIEHIVSHNWGMETVIVPGARAKASELPDEVIDLVGDRPDLEAIAAAVPGADPVALWATATTRGEESVWKVVKALGLPAGVAGFLLGATEASEVEGVTVHLARGISNAIGRSVDIMLGEPESAVKPLELLRVRRRPAPLADPRRRRRGSHYRHGPGRDGGPRLVTALRVDPVRGRRRRPHAGRLHRGALPGQARRQALPAPPGLSGALPAPAHDRPGPAPGRSARPGWWAAPVRGAPGPRPGSPAGRP